MQYALKNCRDGSTAVYVTTLEVTETAGRLCFTFTAKNSQYFCPFHRYNDIHSSGDICELLIGSDPEGKVYYEIEITPENVLMIGVIRHGGFDGEGNPRLELALTEPCFIDSRVTRTEDGYVAELCFDRECVRTGDGEVTFNAYRIETDGGESEKHLFALIPTLRPKFHVPAVFEPLDRYIG